ncbi:MAG: ABC transporter ATP-binding protein [Candidatus Methylarchaceae archaeon HK02M2]|nr:ABC transporter ATP-binding protein [Candidatus Methylarchaceae archaeon HK02M2]
MSSNIMLEILNLWKSYNGNQAVRGLDLKIARGEIFGLLGPNGAGKTTTLKIIVGLLKMDKGIVKIDGIDISENPYDYKMRIGYLPENPTLPEYLTAEEFLGYVAKIRDISSDNIEKKIDYYFKLFDLYKRRKDLIVSYSRGMKQKLAISAALIHDPDFLIVDEPLIGIDPTGQHNIKNILREMLKEDRSVLVSTHMLDTVERLCNRVSIIHYGRNVVSGDLDRLRRISETGEDSTLEEIFLKLTQETEEVIEEGTKKRRFFGLFGKRK